MAQGNIGLRFNVDVSQAKGQVDQLSQSAEKLREKLAELMSVSPDKINWKEVGMLNEALNNATSARGNIMNQARQQNPQAQQQNGFLQGQGAAWIMFQTALNQLTSGIIKSAESIHTAAKQRASGDYTGASVTEQRARGEIAGQAIGTGAGALGFLVPGVGPLLGPLLMGLGGQLGQFLGGGEARKTELSLAYSQQYKNALPLIDSLNQLYGGAVNRKSAEENNRHGLSMYSRASEAASGTGLSTQDFIGAMKEAGKFGNITETQARNMAQTQALWSRFTGTDLSSIQKYAGTAYRYGGEKNAASTAYGGLMASNMGKGQFSEFLTSMGRIMEEGIAKGFVRSSEEIAGNMAMLYKLSGGSKLWQGEQGAQRLSQMNSALANATNLESVEDVISFGVARELLGEDNLETEDRNERREKFIAAGKDPKLYTGTYVDEMMLLEHGVSANLLKGQFEAVNRLEGDNTAAIIERFKNMYGLNYHGATEVWSMYKNSMVRDEEGNASFNFDAEDYQRKIRSFTENPRMQSDSQLLQDSLNRINNTLVSIGSMEFGKELEILGMTQRDVAAILAKMVGAAPVDTRPQAAIDMNIPERRITGVDHESEIPLFQGSYNVRGGNDHKVQFNALHTELDNMYNFNRHRDKREVNVYGRMRAEAMRDNVIDSEELRQLIPALRDVCRVLNITNSRLEGKTDEEVHQYLTISLERD